MRHCVYIFDIEEVLHQKAMKNFTLLTLIPALSLLAFSCSGPAAMQSGEYDDMYYSTADKTEYVQPATEQPYALAEEAEQQDDAASAESGAILNPEYADNTEDITRNYNGNDEYEYYDGREYEPRDNWYRPNYSFVDPSWAYDPYPSYRSYSYHDRYYRHRYGDPFYDPFYYDPFAYRPYYGSGITISIGFNYGWGGYYGRYSPYCYSPYYNNYYGGYYGGYYGHNYVYDYPRYNKPYKVQYGPRGERGGVVTDGVRRDGRGERGDLTETEGSEQRTIQQGRPSRTERGRSTERIGSPTTEERKEVITTRPGRESYRPRNSEARPGRDRVEGTQQQQREQPAIRPATEQPRPNREYRPQRENRQEQRSTEKRSGESAPRRETTRAYEQRETRTTEQRETRHSEPAPSRSSSSESRSSGRPPRGN